MCFPPCASKEWDPFGKLSEIELCKQKRALLKSPTSFSISAQRTRHRMPLSIRLYMNSLAFITWCLSFSAKNQGLDIVPRLLFGRSEFVDVLIESGVARQVGLTAIEKNVGQGSHYINIHG